ncbi:unnamed protein product [Cuscuta epithymum]|uniref:F-box domain-containing protein n=1 Tax=Cuscuta epithymum TaxID=186058 RepID=A0AAV0GLL8_9ASTE|nr:unnamed protein product [Cuscuta epithymum]
MVDRISELPADLKDRILEFLDTKSAARTALLSTQWKDVWYRHGRLKFYCNVYERLASFGNMITEVLSLRSGPVREFSLTICNQEDPALPQSDIDSWCLFLSKNGIEELDLDFSEFQDYDLPVCIVSCPTIKVLNLRNFFVRFPVNAPPRSIFPRLTSALFIDTHFEHSAAGIMSCSIPNLVDLAFSYCIGVQKFVINAPKLESLMVIGSRNEWSEWRWFLLHLPIIKTLWLSPELFVDHHGAAINIQEMLPIAMNVKVIKLYELNFASAKHFDFAVQLIKKCPNLCELEILAEQIFSGHENDEIKAAARNLEDPGCGLIDHELAVLKTVKLASFLGLRLEVQFVKAILSNSPALETLVIQESPNDDIDDSMALGIATEMLHFPRASPKAQVVILEYSYPMVVVSPPWF